MANYNPKLMSMFGQGGSAFGLALLDIVKSSPDTIVLSSDMSTPAGLDKFKAAYPDKFINVGIAEQNMIGIAAGLCAEGYRTIAVAQACFISMRSFEQVRQYAGYMKFPLVLVGIGSGFSLTYFGNTHFANEDMALMRTIPGMQVVAPCDAIEACKALEAAVKSESPTYIRLFGGAGTPIVYSGDIDFAIGESIRLTEGEDLQIFATGSMVAAAMRAAAMLADRGISAEVVDMHTVKPVDTKAINLNVPLIVTVEEHSVIGGLGDAVGAYLLGTGFHGEFHKIGVNDRFSSVGDYQYLTAENGLTPEAIAETITTIISNNNERKRKSL